MKTVREIDVEVENVQGWLHPKEGRLLFSLARACTGRGVIVEIGSWKGRSTIWLANGSRSGRGVAVHAIDPHTGSPQCVDIVGTSEIWTFEEFKNNLKRAGVKDLVVPHVNFSTEVAKKFQQPVEAIFIDGLHEYEGVKTDFDDWLPKVVDGGWMAFHDSTCWPGVRKVVTDGLFKSRRFRKIRFAVSIVYGQKVAQNTFLERLENRLMLGLFLLKSFYAVTAYRLLHSYLDFPLTRAVVQRLKRRQHLRPEVRLPV